MAPQYHRYMSTLLQCVKRHDGSIERVRALVEMDTGAAEAQGWYGPVECDSPERMLRAIRPTHGTNRIAGQLRAQVRLPAQASVTEPVQLNRIPTALSLHHWDNPIACVAIGRSQCAERLSLSWRRIQPNRSRTNQSIPCGRPAKQHTSLRSAVFPFSVVHILSCIFVQVNLRIVASAGT